MEFELCYDHPQSAVANGGSVYKIDIHKRGIFSFYYSVYTGSIMQRNFRRVSSGIVFAYGRDRVERIAREAAREDAFHNGLTKFRGEFH